jgi:hypothetical protein
MPSRWAGLTVYMGKTAIENIGRGICGRLRIIINWQEINFAVSDWLHLLFLVSVFVFCCDDEQYTGEHSVCGYRYTDSS